MSFCKNLICLNKLGIIPQGRALDSHA